MLLEHHFLKHHVDIESEEKLKFPKKHFIQSECGGVNERWMVQTDISEQLVLEVALLGSALKVRSL